MESTSPRPETVERYGGVPPYRETKDYVARVNQVAGERPDHPRTESRVDAIYKSVEVVDGRAVTRYSDHKPATGSYDVVAAP